jgi:hypothetical protein
MYFDPVYVAENAFSFLSFDSMLHYTSQRLSGLVQCVSSYFVLGSMSTP